jgi:hypothetical protein
MAITGTKKLRALLQDFVSTAAEQGYSANRGFVAAELEAHISTVATQLHITEETALRNYLDDDWGREMARDLCSRLAGHNALVNAEPGLELRAQAAGRLVAALRQALLCFTINGGADDGRAGEFSAADASPGRQRPRPRAGCLPGRRDHGPYRGRRRGVGPGIAHGFQ